MNHQLPCVPTRFQFLKRLGQILQLVGLLNDDPDLLVCYPLPQLLQIVPAMADVENDVLAPPAAQEGRYKQPRCHRLDSAEVERPTDLDEPATWHEEVVGGLVQSRRQPSIVNDQRKYLALGLESLRDVDRGVVDDLVGSKRATEVSFAG